MPPPNPKQKTRKFGMGWGGALIPSPKAVGLECVPPSSILLMLPSQIPFSLVVAKLMSNSCAPPPPPSPPTRLRGIKKRAPVPRMLPCWGLCYWVGVNEKVQNTGEPMPIFSKVWALLFSSIFLKFCPPPPPHPLTRALLFFLIIGLTQTCIATAVPPPHMGTLPKLQEDSKKMQKNSWEQGV